MLDTGDEPGMILLFNLSIALCAASELLNSTKQYPIGLLHKYADVWMIERTNRQQDFYKQTNQRCRNKFISWFIVEM